MLNLNDFKKLNGLSPTINSTFTKLEEEKGEVAEIVGKLRRMNGEKSKEIDKFIIYKNLLEELMDICQVCATMIYILEDSFNICISNNEFVLNNSCSSFSYLLKNIAIRQGIIASYILDINDDGLVSKEIALKIIPLYLEICELSSSCICFISKDSNYSIEYIKNNHVDKLIKRGYLI